MQLSLGRSLHGTAAAFFVLAAGSAASVYLSLIGMAQDGRVVNLAGVVRGGSQRMVKQELAGKPADALLAKLDGLVRGLVAGDAGLGLPEATDAEFLSRMSAVTTGWGDLKSAVAAARRDAGQRTALFEASETFFALTDKAVSAAEAAATAKVRRLQLIQALLLALTAACSAFMVFMTQRRVVARSASSSMTCGRPPTAPPPPRRTCRRQASRSRRVPRNRQARCRRRARRSRR